MKILKTGFGHAQRRRLRRVLNIGIYLKPRYLSCPSINTIFSGKHKSLSFLK
jgi:hypothetical protein